MSRQDNWTILRSFTPHDHYMHDHDITISKELYFGPQSIDAISNLNKVMFNAQINQS